MLIKGDQLNERQMRQVLNAFGYRWTIENGRRVEAWLPASCWPTIPKVSDAEWIQAHAFHFLKDGSRLMANRRHAEPAYLAD